MPKRKNLIVTMLLLISWGLPLAAQDNWQLPPITGNARDGWAAGVNMKSNPFEDNGATWSLRYKTAKGLELMKRGLAYKFHHVFSDDAESFDPPTMYLKNDFKARGAKPGAVNGLPSYILFTPMQTGEFDATIEGVVETRKGSLTASLIRVVVLDEHFQEVKELEKVRLKNTQELSWNGKQTLSKGQSIGLELQSVPLLKGHRSPVFLRKIRFSVKPVKGDKVKAQLPDSPNAWRPRNSKEVTVKAASGGGITLLVSPGKGWYYIDGPELDLPERDKFAVNRKLIISAETWPESQGDTNIENYALQIRAKQDNHQYINSLKPRRYWNTIWELADAHKMPIWTKVIGNSRLPKKSTKLKFELVVPAPRSKNAVIHLRNISVKEYFTQGHIFTALSRDNRPMGNIFFRNQGAMGVDFANRDQITHWQINALNEKGTVLETFSGTTPPPAQVNVPLPKPGFYKLVAKAEYSDGTSLESNVTAAVVGPPLSDKIRLNSRFGLNRVHGNMNLWKKSGARWEWAIGKIQLKDWQLAEDGTISPPDDWKTMKDSSGHLVSVGSYPKWLFKPGVELNQSLHPPIDWNLYERLFETFARANPELTLFSSYNEGNGKFRGSRDQYIRFQTAMARGARRGNPKCKIVGPGDYSINLETFEQYLEKGMFDPESGLDGVNIHAYVRGTPPEEEFIERVAGMTKLLREAGRGDIPVYLSEFGWTRGKTDWQPMVSPDIYPAYVARSLLLLTAQDVDAIIYFSMLMTSLSSSKNTLPGYCLLYPDSTPTPGYVAYVNTLKWLSQVKRGDGRWFRISPRINLMLGKTPDGLIGAAWTTQGEGTYKLPAEPLTATDLMGRSIQCEKSMKLTVNPVFFSLPSTTELFEAASLEPKTIGRGGNFRTELTNAFAWDGLIIDNQTVTVSQHAVPGHYLVQGKLNGKTVVQPVFVPEPLEFKAASLHVSPEGNEITAHASVKSTVTTQVKAELILQNGKTFSTLQQIKPGLCIVKLPLGRLNEGERLRGDFIVSTTGSSPYQVNKDIDTTILLTKNSKKDIDWNEHGKTSFGSWQQEKHPNLPLNDCSADFQTAITSEGFRLFVEVKDDVHRQGKSPSAMWQEDSLQVAFDIDAGKPWLYNLISDGRYNGHRIVYYSIGKSSKNGQVMAWRNRANCPGLTGGSHEPRIKADISRKENTTVYDITFPWATLGTTQMPQPGDSIGFCLVVNDSDKGYDRKFLTFGNGIVGPQNPELYATLKVVKKVNNKTEN